jgi:hypothetical protein
VLGIRSKPHADGQRIKAVVLVDKARMEQQVRVRPWPVENVDLSR